MKNGVRKEQQRAGFKGVGPAVTAGRAPAAQRSAPFVFPDRSRDADPAALTVVEPVASVVTSRRARAKARARKGARRMPVEKVLAESQRWLDTIARGSRLTAAEKKRVIKETVKSFSTYFNSGFLAYRK